jgi:hypothetical protein
VGAELFHAMDRRKDDARTHTHARVCADMKMLIVTFHNFADMPNKAVFIKIYPINL